MIKTRWIRATLLALKQIGSKENSLLLVALFAFEPLSRAGVLVHDFYLPMPEAQIKQTFDALETGVSNTLDSTFSIVVTGEGTVIHYDQWEDGYEIDLANPTQASTKIWGDGNNLNGIAPGFANDPAGLPVGTALTLRNLVPLPRNPSNLLYDGRDRVAATKALVVARMAWPTSPGSVLADAIQVPATIDYGTNYISPVGQDLTNAMFQYVGLFVMAGADNTSVTIDTDGSGPAASLAVNLNRGESYLVNGGIRKGASIAATKAVQAELVVGKKGGRYASDWFTLVPVSEWGSSYVTPVPTPNSGNTTYVYLYNPANINQTINYTTRLSSGSFAVASNGVYQFAMPKSSGARFTSSGGGTFFALSTVAANPGNEAPYDWGFSLLPTDNLTSEAVVGLGLGSSDNTQNGSPVWVSPLAAARVYVDYKGDRLGALTDPNGNKYDTNFDLVTLQSQKIYDRSSTNKSQTGMRVYTLGGTLFSTVWGEDADVAGAGNPYIDAGTTVLPFPMPTLTKSSTITNDTSPPGISIGDTLEYTIQLDNKGLLPLGNTLVIDTLPANITYVANTTTLNGNAVPDSPSGSPFPLDSPGYTIPIILRAGTSTFKFHVLIAASGTISNSVNAAGYNLIAANVVAPLSTNSTQCALDFTDAGGTPVGSYVAGGAVYGKVTDADGNTSSNSIQSVSVIVSNSTSGDFELVTLAETGNNTGIFRNVGGLPTSLSAGLPQLDGTLKVSPGDILSARYIDSAFADTCSAAATVQAPARTKVLYLSDPGQSLDRVNPVATADNTTAQSVELGGGTSASIGIEGTNSVAGTNVSSVNFSYTTGSGANGLMLVSVGTDQTRTVNSVTYNGVALTSVGAIDDAGSTKPRVELFRLVNPTPGSHTLAVTLNTSANVFVGVNTFTNVDQTTPLGTAATSANLTSVTVSSAANELVYGAVCGEQTETDAVGQTRLWGRLQGTIFGAGSTKPGAASVTLTWTPGGGAVKIAMVGVPIKPVTSGGANVTSFTQSPAFCQNFVMPSGGAVAITNFVTVTSGVMPANPNITAQLRFGSSNVITLSNPTYTAGNSNLVWTGTMGGTVTIPSGQALDFVVSNAQSGVSFRLDHDSAAKPAKIMLPTTTVIDVNNVSVYDAPYPGGNIVSTPLVGSTLYVRVDVSDPFGSYDISSLDLSFDGPGNSGDINTTLTDSSLVASNGCSKTYEYAWSTTTEGSFAITATGNEGSEGITDVAAASVELLVLDTGTPGTAEFTSSNDGVATNAFPADGTVCVRVSDSDKNTNSFTAQTITAVITSTSGDSETTTLTETGTNSGVFTACITALTNSPVTNNNSVLTAPVSSVLTVSYTDPLDVSDQSSDTATVIPPPGTPRVTMNKTVVTPADGQAGVGETVEYNLQVINSGSTTLTNVSVTDNFPSNNLSYASASLSPTTVGAGMLTWNNVGPLAVGATTNILISFTATSTASSAVNRATANAGGSTTNLDSVAVQITHASLTITKTMLNPTNGPVNIGSNITFRIVVQNTGDTAIPTLPLEDTFSASCFSNVSATVTPDGTGAGSLLWNDITGAGSLATNASITIDIVMRVTGGCDPANNTAHADYAVDVNGDPVPVATSTASTTTGAARIIGNVYNDVDQSGTLTPGDVDLDSVTIELYDDPNADGNPSDGSLVRLTATDSSGAYELLNLVTGAYVVVETDLPGFASSFPANNRLPLVITTLTTNANNNFFDYLLAPTNYAIIGGTVWNDTNANGVVNPGETGIFNVAIELVQDVNTNGFADLGETVAASTTTDTNGGYSFVAVTPGNYVIQETDLYGYISSADSRPPNDNQISLLVGSGAVTNGNDFLDFFTGNNPGNDAPVANNDVYSASEDTPLTISAPGILDNDTDVDGDTLTAILVTTTTNGTLSLNTNGGFAYTPNTNYAGADSFTYRANDSTTNSGIAFVNLTVTPINDAPIANSDSYTTSEDNTLTVPVAGILTNDTDVEGSVLTALLVSTTTNGTLSLNPNGSFTYTPNTNYNGGDSFAYRATDGSATSGVATVTITITPVNDAPVANSDGYSTAEDAMLTVPVAGILTNDTDVEGSVLTALLESTTTNGTLSLNSNGSFTYTPNTNYNGGDSFAYRATDGLATSSVATVTITITPSNDPPIANGQVATMPEDTTTNLVLTATDADSTNLTFTILVSPTNGVMNGFNPNTGAATYAPNTNYSGPDNFRFTVSDGSLLATGTVSITVTPLNDAPFVTNDFYTVFKNSTLTIPVTGVLTNDFDVEGSPLIAVLVSGPTNAAAFSLSTNGSFSYTPLSNYTGLDTFTYRATDGSATSAIAFASINILSTNTPPVANNLTVTTPEDRATNLVLTASDVDGNPLTFIIVNGPTNGVLNNVNTNAGTFTYTPNTNFNGGDSFTFRVNDGTTNSGPAIVSITVTPLNDPPVANSQNASTPEDTATNLVLTASDADGNPFTFIIVSGPTNGVLNNVNTNAGTLTYAPNTNFNGGDSFTFRVNDGTTNSGPAIVSITVTPLNDPPVANSQSLTNGNTMPFAITLTGSDVDGPVTNFTVLTQPGGGTLTGSAPNLTYTPSNNFAGIVTFTFNVNDGSLTSSVATVTVTITNAASADVAIFKTGSASTTAGSNVTYTITATNLGPVTSVNVVVNDQLPAGFTFISSVPATATVSNNLVTWPAFNLASGAANNFTVTARPAEGGSFTNIAFSTSGVPDPNSTNNNGTLPSSTVTTTVMPSADVAIFKAGGTNVFAGSNLTYTITATNGGPSTAANVVVRDTLPTAAIFQSASGSFTLSNNVVSWAGLTLSNGAVASFTVTVTTPASGNLTNIASSTAGTPDPNSTNNSGALPSSFVRTTITPVADVAVFKSGPASVTNGANFTYTITLTNRGPSTASSVVVRDFLPTNLTFISASSGGLFATNTVTWPAIPSLTNGATTNFTLTVLANTLGSITNIVASSATTIDSDPSNNNGASSGSQVTTAVITPSSQFSSLIVTNVFNPQTGLYEEIVVVTNDSGATASALRVYATGLRSGVYLQNASGTNSGKPYVFYNVPLPAGSNVTMLLEFLSVDRHPFTNGIEVEITTNLVFTPATGTPVGNLRIFQETYAGTQPHQVIEFATIPGRSYMILYGDAGPNSTTNVATPNVVATANAMQWIDAGPPKTATKPSARFYRVILLP